MHLLYSIFKNIKKLNIMKSNFYKTLEESIKIKKTLIYLEKDINEAIELIYNTISKGNKSFDMWNDIQQMPNIYLLNF